MSGVSSSVAHVRLHDDDDDAHTRKHKSHATDSPSHRHGSGSAPPAGRTRRNSSAPVPVALGRRWIMLAIFSIVTLSNAAAWITFAPIADVTQEHFGVSAFAVNSLSLVYMLAYMPFVFVASWLLDKYGLRPCVFCGAVLNALGQWLRVLGAAPSAFIWLAIGQTIAAIGQAFILGVPTRLSAVWFAGSERNTATALGVMSNQLGVAVGFLVGPQVLNNGGSMGELMLVEAVFASVGAVLVTLLFANEPPVPPSFAAIVTATPGVSTSYMKQLRQLVTHKSFMYLVHAYGANVGMYYAYSTFLNQLLLPHFPAQDVAIGWVGFVIVVAGLIGDVGIGFYLDKTHKYKVGFLVCNAGAFLSYIGFVLSMKIESLPLVFLSAGLMGIFGTSVLVLGLEYGAQITFPVPEATSAGLLNLLAQVYGAILVATLTVVEENVAHGIVYVQWGLAAVIVLSELLVVPVKSTLKRLATEDEFKDGGALPQTGIFQSNGSQANAHLRLLSGGKLAQSVATMDDHILDTPKGRDRV